MVEAILDGRKTVTRRAIKGFTDDELLELEKDPWVLYYKKNGDEREKHANGLYATFRNCDMAKAPYEPGDILYVRETWSTWGSFTELDPAAGICDGYIYKADWDAPPDFEQPPWKSPASMPIEAARLFLRVTDIAVCRIQSTSYKAERNFADLWDRAMWNRTIEPKELDLYGWKANPWVWVISFERISKAEAIQDERKSKIHG